MAFQKFDAHNDYILKCLVSDDLKYLATCSADKTIKLWVMIQDKGYVLHSTLYGNSLNKQDIRSGFGMPVSLVTQIT